MNHRHARDLNLIIEAYRRYREAMRERIMSDAQAYSDSLEVEALLSRLGVRWTEKP